VSDKKSDQPDERKLAEDDAKEDLELKDEDADQVRGGLTWKYGSKEK
jgi:hypothetical protein